VTVYVDDMRLPVRTGQHEVHWSQLLADSEIELHVFAARLGLGRHSARELESPIAHYEVNETMRRKALAAGAVAIGYLSPERAELIRRRRAATHVPVDSRVAAAIARTRSVDAQTG
jgi:SOS-response transcriptional repressor LexA